MNPVSILIKMNPVSILIKMIRVNWKTSLVAGAGALVAYGASKSEKIGINISPSAQAWIVEKIEWVTLLAVGFLAKDGDAPTIQEPKL